MNIHQITLLYILFLVGISVGLDSETLPKPRTLVAQYAPQTLKTHVSFRRIPYDDKIAHFFLVGLLAFLTNLSLSLSSVSIGGRRFLTGSLLLFALVTLEECSQIFFPARSFSFGDLWCNYAGVLCFGQAAIWFVRHQREIEMKFPCFLVKLFRLPEKKPGMKSLP